MDNRIAAVWARVSTKGQSELSPDGQAERVKAKLEGLGYIVPPHYVFKVDWTSLDLDPCPEFRELKTLISQKKIDAVGMLDRDRLEAEGLQRLMFLADCRENGVQPVVYQGPPFLEGDEGQVVELVLSIGKKKSVERAQLGARQGLFDRATKKALPPTTRKVYGMKWGNGKFVPDEDYGSAGLIWRLGLQGCKLKSIGKELLGRGISSPRGKSTWAPSSIRSILTNPVYAGRIATLKYERVEPKERRGSTYGKTSARLKSQEEWHWLEGLVESPIVTWDEYVAVQERLKLNKLGASRNAKRNYLLRGLIECQLCRRHYYGVQRTRQLPAYVCSASWAQTYGQKCQAKPLPCSDIESEVKEKIRSFLKSPDVYLTEADRRAELTNHTIGNIEQNIRDLEGQYQQTIEDERRSLKLLTDEAFSQEQTLIKAKRTWLTDEIARQKAKLAQLHQLAINRHMVETMRQRLHTNLDQASNEDWRRILEALGARILAFGDGTWDIEINIPTADANCLQNSLVYLSLATS